MIPEKVTRIIHKLKKNRAPGLDGFTIERLYSLSFGGGGQSEFKKEELRSYTAFIKRLVVGDLTPHQLTLMHSLKLAGIPKTELVSRVITMFYTHSKVAFSIFTSSKLLKRRVEKEAFTFTCQFGSKKAGSESMIHVMQHMMEQSLQS